MSNLIRLFLPDGKPTRFALCKECGTLKSADDVNSTAFAEYCCHCEECEALIPTGKAKWYGRWCDSCWSIRAAEKEKERFQKAEKIQSDGYHGPVWYPHCGYNDGFFDDVESLLDYLQDNLDEDGHKEGPRYAFAVNAISFVQIDCRAILENFDEPDDFDYELDGVQDLESAVEAFEAKNAELKRWDVDYSRAIILPEIVLEGEVEQ